MFWIKEKFVSLHRKTEMKCSIGLWCNGNTTDSGPVIPGSNPGSPTITHQQKPTKIASFSGFCCFSTMCKFFIIGIRWSNRWLCQNKNISKFVLTQPLFICLLL